MDWYFNNKGGVMWKKLFLVALMLIFMAGVAWASPVNLTFVAETQLDDDPTSVTATYRNIQDYKKVGFVVKYDETEAGNSISVAVSLDVSYDGTNWIDAYFYDWAGGTTLQTSETLSSDGWYWCWFDPDWSLPPYVRMVIAATNSDADDLATVTAYLIGLK